MDIEKVKLELKKKVEKNINKYYAVDFLKQRGFERKTCKKCGARFWTKDPEREFCGEPDCVGGYSFIGKPVGKRLEYIESWNKFSEMFKSLGYTPIKRYPVVARWRDDTDFVQASIYDFQPHVVSGEVEPPANPLVVPQYCLRFNDIDNVGITGRHKTGFVMVGQHAFLPPKDFDQNLFLSHIHKWLTVGMKIPEEEISYIEKQWYGGGNLGVCMEAFVRGLEIENQVYMIYKVSDAGYEELPIRVLDMGMGLGRTVWVTQGSATQYESDYPDVIKKLFEKTGLELSDMFRDFMPFAGELNVEENKDIEKSWQKIAEKLSVSKEELKKEVMPLAALFSVADHSQSLLVALSDGMLPSNVGGGYNLRVIARRAMSFIDKYGWPFSLQEVAEWHAAYLRPLFPELNENIDDVMKILDIEKKKYRNARQRTKKMVVKILKKKRNISADELRLLYESYGITPELIREVAENTLNVNVSLPENFYALITRERPERKREVEKEFDLKGIAETEKLYYEDDVKEFDAEVLKEWEEKGKHYVVLDRTAFYPLGGGQASDKGKLDGAHVVAVIKQGNIVIHETDRKLGKKQVHGVIDWERRLQLTRQHTGAHILNGAAREILGNHIWQAGAEKNYEKARLDITHYEIPTAEEISRIEKLANEVIRKAIPIERRFMPRTEAEQKYGFRLYQGGAVPGKMIRVVNIKGFDVEACGGTHFSNTKYVEEIKIWKVKKIQDGVIRIEFSAGKEMIAKLMKRMKEEKDKEKAAWLKRVELLIAEKEMLTGKKERIDVEGKDLDSIIKIWKQLSKELEKEKKRKASELSEETVQIIDVADMKLMQEIARKVAKKKAYCVVLAPGQVIGVDNKSGKPVKEAVEKAAEIMGGKAGGKGNEWKGGGPEKNKYKEAFNQVRKILGE
ncbi:alanine--tRNA ligase [Candidatus Micrarchaeota archaeon]|nr:MAG: alanine--tRNA ligase [Candidatus Micrarchaeota archaeon]